MKEKGQLLEALGGEAGCAKLAVAFYAGVAKDAELRPLFPGKSLRCATDAFSAFLVQFLGGDEESTQLRWWLSLRESHARFRITEVQRQCWLSNMEKALNSSALDSNTRRSLLQFFAVSSAYLLGAEVEPIENQELAERWQLALALDKLVRDVDAGRDDEVLQSFRDFRARRSLFVGILARMCSTGRPALVCAVARAIEQDRTLAMHRYAGRTLLHFAAAAGCAEIVELLLDQGADANVLDALRHPPLYHLANECAADTGPEIVRMLVRAAANVNYCGGATRTTPLHMAARRGNVNVARALLNCGASLESVDTRGCTPLVRAQKCRKRNVVELFNQYRA